MSNEDHTIKAHAHPKKFGKAMFHRPKWHSGRMEKDLGDA
jgi:hypothetical protein